MSVVPPMAREAGLSRVQADLLELGKDVSFDIEMLDAFATLVAAAEREACARAVLAIANDDAGNPYKQALRMGAEAIRARGQA